MLVFSLPNPDAEASYLLMWHMGIRNGVIEDGVQKVIGYPHRTPKKK
jgi:hypothetical protein